MALLRRQLRHARDHSPFYRRHLASVAIDRLRRPQDLGTVPFLRREDLALNFDGMGCVPRSRYSDMFRTSGTTGRRVLIPLTWTEMRRMVRMMARDLAAAGITAGETCLLMLPADELICPTILMDQVFRNELRGLVLRVGIPSPERLLEYVTQLRPSLIFSAPHPCLRLAHLMQERGVRASELGLRRLLLTGQPLYGEGWQPNALKRRLEALWDVPILSVYGATEYCGGWTECPFGRGHHLAPEHVVFEVVDPETGLPVDGPGELVFTSLTREAMPMIRYRTGDVSWIERDPCPCGRSAPRIMAILGRTDQMLKIKGARLYPEEVEESILSVPGVRGHLVEVYRNDDGEDMLRVRVTLDGSAGDAANAIRRQVRERTRVTPLVELVSLAELERDWFDHGGRKPRRFRDLRRS